MMIQRMRLRNRNQERRKPIDRQVAFLEYKNNDEGKEIEQSIMTCRTDLLERRMEMKSATDSCNALKNRIDGARNFLEQKANSRRSRANQNGMNPDINTRTEGFIEDHGEDAEVIDEEELNKLKELKDLKRQYRDAFTVLKNKKNEASYTQQAIDNAK